MDERELIENPEALGALVQQAVQHLIQQRPDMSEQEAQLREVARTIERLEKLGLSIPEELRRLKTNLAVQNGQQPHFEQQLRVLGTRLAEVLEMIEDAISKPGLERKFYTASQIEYIEFYKDLIKRLKSKIPRNYSPPQPTSYYMITTGISAIHYEWGFHGRPRSSFGVELHFERGNRDSNLEILSHLEDHIPGLEKALNETVKVQKEWGKNWSRLYIDKCEGQFTNELKEWAVEKMEILIKTFQPILDRIK